MAIRINSENKNNKIKIDLTKISKAAENALRALNNRNCEVNIVFVSSQKMRVFNKRYFGKDLATDVIAFPAVKDEISNHESRITNYVFLGDIIISTDRAKRNTKIYGLSVKEEITLYVVHGILHLVGYEDTDKEKFDRMKKKEDEIFKKVKRTLR